MSWVSPGIRYFFQDVLHMHEHVGPDSRRRAAARAFALGFPEEGEALQRELGIDHETPLVAGQAHEAIRPRAVRQGGLELEGIGRQSVADDRLHPPLPVGAPGLLVGEDVLEPHDLAGEVRQVLLGRIDHGEPFVQLGEVLGLVARGGLQPLPDPVLQPVDPLRDHPREIALAGAEDLGHGPHPPGHLRLRPSEFGDHVVHLSRPLGGDGNLQRPISAGSQEKHRHEQEQNQARPRHPHDDLPPGQGCLAEDQDDVVHGAYSYG
jgi:hypothetical protein